MNRLARAGAATTALVLLSASGTAAASSTASTTPQIVNREVVQAMLHSNGSLDVARLFSQLSVVGKGTVNVADPVSTKGLRNLDGFGKPRVRDGQALYTIHVDGTANRRTVSDFTKALPVDVHAVYTLGGKSVKPQDLVGKTGDVTATYTITNVSGTPTVITWKDGKGVTQSETIDLVTPYVGQVSTTLPGNFTDLVTPVADVAADGRGGTVLTYSMVLFDPIGNPTQTFTWSGHVKKARIPAVTVQIVPVAPSAKPELNTGVVGYRDGAAQASELTSGAGQIDSNLLALQHGAGDLLAGLTKLAAGAAELRNGLKGKIVPGASALASGATAAKAGSAALSSGLAQLSAGLNELSGASGLPAAKAGAIALRAGVDALLAGLGSASKPTTILGGLAQLSAGAGQVATGLTGVRGGLDQLAAPTTGLPAAKGGVDAVKAGLDAATATGGSIDQLIGAATLAGDLVVAGGLRQLKAQTQAAAAGLGQVSTGLAGAIAGVGALRAGVGDAATAGTLRNGVALIQGGLAQVTAGVGQVVLGLKSNSTAHPGIAEGLDALVSGLTTAVAGVGQLDSGAQSAATGSNALDSGLGKLAAGAGQLSSGLTTAADGSGQLADGLAAAKAGNLKVVDGAGQLRAQGTSKLIGAGNDTASENAKKYATLAAMGDKVADGALPYGAPEGAKGSSAYQLTLAAATTATRDNTLRAIVALLLLVAAGAVSWMVRRRRTGSAA